MATSTPASTPPPHPTTHTVAVTGASGFVGRRVVRELLARGHSVRALVRDAAKARGAFGSPFPTGVELVPGDVCDSGSVRELLRGCTACIHLVGIIRETRGEPGTHAQTFDRMHVFATQVVTEACRGAGGGGGVGRYLHMSALGVSAEGKAAYQKTKHQGEQIVRRSGLDWTIFRPSVIHGPDSEFVRMMADLVSGEVAPWYFIPYFIRLERDTSVLAGPVAHIPAKVQPVAVEDVARVFVEALDRRESIGEVYNLVGSEVLNWQEISEFIRDTVPGAHRNMGTWHIPGRHAAAIATALSRVGLGSLLPFDAGQALMATEDSTADLSKVRADFGLEPKPFRATFRAYAAQI